MAKFKTYAKFLAIFIAGAGVEENLFDVWDTTVGLITGDLFNLIQGMI